MLCLFLAGLTAIATVSAERVVPIPAAQLLPHPPMHWHSWNQFSGEGTVTDANMRSIADALVTTGMAAAGCEDLDVHSFTRSLVVVVVVVMVAAAAAGMVAWGPEG